MDKLSFSRRDTWVTSCRFRVSIVSYFLAKFCRFPFGKLIFCQKRLSFPARSKISLYCGSWYLALKHIHFYFILFFVSSTWCQQWRTWTRDDTFYTFIHLYVLLNLVWINWPLIQRINGLRSYSRFSFLFFIYFYFCRLVFVKTKFQSLSMYSVSEGWFTLITSATATRTTRPTSGPGESGFGSLFFCF